MQRKDLMKMQLPDAPGVYLFKKGKKILYIGKAASLRDRVGSYFSTDLGRSRAPTIVAMVAEADSISYQSTDSVLEALILEANLIKKHQPPANVDAKDNKSWNYVVITKESFPRVLVVRGRELFEDIGFRKSKFGFTKSKYVFGPFPEGGSLKEALKIIRKIFPFRDSKCIPCEEQNVRLTKSNMNKFVSRSCQPCFNRQIGLCPGVCTGEITKEEYMQQIKHISQFFSGNFKGLKRELAGDMKQAAANELFEDAARFCQQIHALEHIRDVALIKDENRYSYGGPLSSLKVNVRIEAFDAAHTSGQETVAVMTVVQSGEPEKAAYRMFKIRSAENSDVASLKEALSRRLNHAEWPLPRVFVVDGGKAQMNGVRKVLREAGIEIPIVGVVKNQFHKPERLIGDERAIEAYEKDILLANSEAHRFGIAFHRRRRQKNLIL